MKKKIAFKKVGKSLGSAFRSGVTVAFAVALTIGLFLLLPLIQELNASDTSRFDSDNLSKIQLDEPPPVPEDEEPEPEEPEEAPPEESFELGDQISFDDLNSILDGQLGGSGAGGRDFEALLSSLGGGGGEEELFSTADLDQAPLPKFIPNPNLPPALLKRKGVSVDVVFTCTSTGRVQDARILQSQDAAFNSATLASIRKSTWEPGRRGDTAVSTRNCKFTYTY
ncbi:MAG: energy transducer TonB [Planctomycetota bacterium]